MNKIILRPILESDLKQLYEWRNDPEIMARTRQHKNLEWKEHVEWFKNLDTDKNIMRIIIIGSTITIGVCGLVNIDYINRSTELSLYIGEEKYKRQGYGSAAVEEMKKICFDQLNLHRFWAEVYSFNTPMQSLLTKSGFGHEATLTDAIYRNGKYYASYFYNFLEDAWQEQKNG